MRRTQSNPGTASSIGFALDDLRAGLKRYELWIFMGWREVRKQYQRSIIGPFWLTLNLGVLVAGLGLLYSQILNQEIEFYLPYLAAGMIIWAMIGAVINDSCLVFSSAAMTIRQVPMPLSVHVYQFIWKHIITFLHNFVIFVLLAVIFGLWPGFEGLMFLPAMAVLVINGVCMGLILGTLSARFRDIPPIVTSVTQLLFFMTPIIWSASALPSRSAFLNFNPLYHFLEIARQPLLGQSASLLNWSVALGVTAVTVVVAVLFFSRFRSRIAYWA